MSSSESINHNALKFLVEADAVNQVTAVAYADKWSLRVRLGNKDADSGETNEKTVVSKNSGKTRVWRKLDTLAKYLQDLGVNKFATDVTKYDPSKQTLRRPDSAAALKRTHSAHKRLIDEKNIQVPTYQATPKGSDASPSEVRKSWEKRRAKILQESNPRAK